MTIISAAVTLFFVMDPLGNIPVFLSVLSSVDKNRRTKIVLRECLFAWLILVAFLFFGHTILFGLGISQSSLSIAGGIILFLIALKMIFPPENPEATRDLQLTEPFVVPLAIPLVAGPSSIAMVMLFATQSHGQALWPTFIALLIASTTPLTLAN